MQVTHDSAYYQYIYTIIIIIISGILPSTFRGFATIIGIYAYDYHNSKEALMEILVLILLQQKWQW